MKFKPNKDRTVAEGLDSIPNLYAFVRSHTIGEEEDRYFDWDDSDSASHKGTLTIMDSFKSSFHITDNTIHITMETTNPKVQQWLKDLKKQMLQEELTK